MNNTSRPDIDAAIVAAKLKQKARKQAVIRMMASNIYGHLHGDKLRSQRDEDDLVIHSVKSALAIWHEVEKQV